MKGKKKKSSKAAQCKYGDLIYSRADNLDPWKIKSVSISHYI